MSLSYSATTGRLTASDDTQPGSPVMFDTNDGLLFVDPADVFEGSVEIPARTASSQGVDGTQTVVDVEQDYFIGIPSSPGSRYVRGMIRTTATSDGEMMDAVWRQASGSHLDAMDGVSITTTPQSDLGGFERLATLRTLTFFVNELGHLVMRERAVARARDRGSPGTAINRVCAASTVDYRLLVGSFFGADFNDYPGLKYLGRNGVNDESIDFSLTQIGYEYPSRRLIAAVTGTGGVPDSVTIDGVSFTLLGSGGVGSDSSVSLWEGILSVGTSVDVELSWSGGQNHVGVAIYAINNSSGPPTITDGTSSTGVLTASVDMSGNKVGIAVTTKEGGTLQTVNWINASGNFTLSQDNVLAAAIIDPGATEVTAQWSDAGNGGLVCAVWG